MILAATICTEPAFRADCSGPSATYPHSVKATSAAIRDFVDLVFLWGIQRVPDDEVIRAAADALAVQGGGSALADLAGLPWGRSHDDFETLLSGALEEFGLRLPRQDSDERSLLGLAAMARQCLRGDLKPVDLATWAHLLFAGPAVPPQAVALEQLYYAYDEDVAVTESQADREVIAQAERLIHLLP